VETGVDTEMIRSGAMTAAEREAAWKQWLARALARPPLPPEELTPMQRIQRQVCVGDASVNARSNA